MEPPVVSLYMEYLTVLFFTRLLALSRIVAVSTLCLPSVPMVVLSACKVSVLAVVATNSLVIVALGPLTTDAVMMTGPALSELMVTVAWPNETGTDVADKVPRVAEKSTDLVGSIPVGSSTGPFSSLHEIVTL